MGLWVKYCLQQNRKLFTSCYQIQSLQIKSENKSQDSISKFVSEKKQASIAFHKAIMNSKFQTSKSRKRNPL